MVCFFGWLLAPSAGFVARRAMPQRRAHACWHPSLHCASTHLLPGVQAAPAKTPEELELEALEAEMAQ